MLLKQLGLFNYAEYRIFSKIIERMIAGGGGVTI
jgi:hypothetical protein